MLETVGKIITSLFLLFSFFVEKEQTEGATHSAQISTVFHSNCSWPCAQIRCSWAEQWPSAGESQARGGIVGTQGMRCMLCVCSFNQDPVLQIQSKLMLAFNYKL